MLRLFLFLISIISFNANAVETNFSGFLYNTSFSDNDFHENRTALIINGDAFFNGVALRTQLSSEYKQPRRATVEYSFPVGKSEVVYQIGRFGRTNTFYNSILDSPAGFQMAMLPLAGYSYRMYNGAFVLMDGQQILLRRTYDSFSISGRAATGKMVIDDQEELQLEAFKRHDPDIEMKSTKHNYDIGLQVETENYKAYVSRNKFNAKLKTNSTNPLTKYIASNFSDSTYTIDKFGIQYDNKKYFGRYEFSRGNTMVKSDKGKDVSESDSKDWNTVIGMNIREDDSIYIGYSNGRNMTRRVTYEDSFVGYTLNYKRLTTSIEYHEGHGEGWMRYKTESSSKTWNSWVISTTFKF